MRHLAGRAFAVALAATCATAHADSHLDFAGEGACPVLFRSIEVAGPRLRFELEPPGAEPMASIFDGDEDLVTSLLPAQRKFMRMEVDADAADYSGDVASSSVKYMDRQMAQAMKQMEAQCRGNQCAQIPDLQAMMRAAMPSAPPIEARATNDAGTVAGIACQWREWVQAGVVVRRECLANIADLPLPAADVAGLRRGMRVMMNFGAAYSPIRDRFGLAPEPSPPAGQLAVAQVCLQGDAQAGKAEVSLREAPVDPLRFEVPAGYAPAMGQGAE
jgi:hypothetical protein